jgi:hypothetical protein
MLSKNDKNLFELHLTMLLRQSCCSVLEQMHLHPGADAADSVGTATQACPMS